MHQGGDADFAFETAVARYKQGRCPGCGKGLGEPRGLELRTRTGDLYCHTCRVPWPMEMDAVGSRDKLSIFGVPKSDTLSAHARGPSLQATGFQRQRTTGGEPHQLRVALRRLGHFFKRTVRGH